MSNERIVLDTNIVSYLFKGDALTGLYRRHLEGRMWCISFVTVAEMHFGAYKDAWSNKELNRLNGFLRHGDMSVLEHNYHTSLEWARIRSELGRKIAENDAWIAASARVRGMPLVTHDHKDFHGIRGLEVITESGG